MSNQSQQQEQYNVSSSPGCWVQTGFGRNPTYSLQPDSIDSDPNIHGSQNCANALSGNQYGRTLAPRPPRMPQTSNLNPGGHSQAGQSSASTAGHLVHPRLRSSANWGNYIPPESDGATKEEERAICESALNSLQHWSNNPTVKRDHFEGMSHQPSDLNCVSCSEFPGGKTYHARKTHQGVIVRGLREGHDCTDLLTFANSQNIPMTVVIGNHRNCPLFQKAVLGTLQVTEEDLLQAEFNIDRISAEA
jgi:hypothetical protein